MTLTRTMRVGAVALTIALAGFLVLGNQRPAHALGITDISGGAIDQGVFCFLDQFPTTDVFNTGCAPTPTTGSLTVTKIVTGTSTPSADFDIHVMSDGSDIANSPQPGDSSGTAYGDLTPGTYTISEAVNAAGTAAGVTMSDFSPAFSGDCDAGGNLTVAANANATCTITNTYVPPVVAPTTGGLVVDKVVVNTGGGVATPSWFSFAVNDGATTTWNADGENDFVAMAPGTFSVLETATSSYTSAYSGCTGTITAGATSTCTVTNTYVVPPPPPSCTIVSDTNTEDVTDSHPAVLVSAINTAWTATSDPIAFDPSAMWIWSEDPAINTTVNVTKDFVRTFNIVGTPESGSIDIGADNGFVLKVNGTTVVDNSAVENNYSASQHYDISSDLVSGTNTIEVDVTNFGVADSDGSSNPAGTVFQVNIPDNACTTSGGGGGSSSSDLSVTKTVDNSSPVLGQNVTYTITATNSGPDDATGVTVTDQLPAGLTYVSDDGDGSYDSTSGVWTIGTLSDGSSQVLHIVATVNAADEAGDAITNTATISGSNTDSDSENNSANAAVDPAAPDTASDLTITKTASEETANVGDQVTYTITVSNSGPADASDVAVSDMLPEGLTFVSTSTQDTVGVYDASTGIWTIGTLPDEGSVTLNIVASVNTGTEGDTITNSASVSDTNGNSNSENDTATAPVTVNTPSTPTPTISGGGGGGGGGGNGPIAGSFGGGGNGPIVAPQGEVLGASTSTLPASCSQYLTAFIRSGANNDASQVRRLQEFLNQFEGDNLAVNGIYDASTLAALEAFQSKYAADVLTPWGESAPTGYVYLTTRREVNEIYCHFTQNFPLTPTQQAEISAYRDHQTGGQGSTVSVPTPATLTPTVSDTQENENTQQTGSTSAPMDMLGESQAGAAAASAPQGGFWSSVGGFFSHIFR